MRKETREERERQGVGGERIEGGRVRQKRGRSYREKRGRDRVRKERGRQ